MRVVIEACSLLARICKQCGVYSRLSANLIFHAFAYIYIYIYIYMYMHALTIRHRNLNHG